MFRLLVVAVALVCAAISLSPASAARAGCGLTADVNPSVAGQEVNFDVGCLKANATYEVGIQDWSGGTGVGFAITGDFAYTFATADTYWVVLYEKPNRAQAPREVARVIQTVN